MGGEASAYTALGLEPGADAAAIDAAYRSLIKLHHPDRSGGDAERAAEINRAYFELKRKRAVAFEPGNQQADIAEAIYARRASRTPTAPPQPADRRPWIVLIAAAAALLYIGREQVVETAEAVRGQFVQPWSPVVRSAPGSAPVAGSIALDGDLDEAAVRSSISDARRLVGKSEDRLAEHTRTCHRTMRATPGQSRLDRCAAFDYAVGLLQDRELLRDEGPFSATAITARQMAAASLLSNDFLAIEARLDRIRSRVELALAPPPMPAAEPVSNLAELG